MASLVSLCISRGGEEQRLDPSVVPFLTPYLGEGSPTKIEGFVEDLEGFVSMPRVGRRTLANTKKQRGTGREDLWDTRGCGLGCCRQIIS